MEEGGVGGREPLLVPLPTTSVRSHLDHFAYYDRFDVSRRPSPYHFVAARLKLALLSPKYFRCLLFENIVFYYHDADAEEDAGPALRTFCRNTAIKSINIFPFPDSWS
jgi:hypothetical protein